MKSIYHIGCVSNMVKHQVKFDNAFQYAIEKPQVKEGPTTQWNKLYTQQRKSILKYLKS